MLRRVTGIAMLALEATLLWYTMGYLAFAVASILVALIGCWPRLQWSPGYRIKVAASLLVGGVYLVWWWLRLQYVEPSWSAQFGDNFSLAAALGLMMIQALQFHWRHPQGLPGYYTFLAALALAFAGDRYFTEKSEHNNALILVMFFGLLVGVFLAAGAQGGATARHRAYRYALLSLCFTLSFVLAGSTAWLIGHSEQTVGQWLANQSFPQNLIVLGNRQRARLGSIADIKGSNAEHIALQIVAEASPGYLRGQVYGAYGENGWGAFNAGDETVIASNAPPEYIPLARDERLYEIAAAPEHVAETLKIYPERGIDRAMFLPMDTGWAAIAGGGLWVNEANVVQSKETLAGRPYQTLTTMDQPLPELSDEDRNFYTKLPEKLAPRLNKLAAKICRDKHSTLHKTGAIAQYFTGNYNYTLGIDVPLGKDPMEYFLFSDPLPDAHCEFFATGTALLLRAEGIPARYVTGVGVWEKHPIADYWVARNRDAHAWVEAWDDEAGWFIVESTPASGLPEAGQAQGTNPFTDFWHLITLQTRRLISAIREGAWPVVGSMLRSLLLGGFSFLRAVWWLLFPLLALAATLWYLRRHLKRPRARRAAGVDESARRMGDQLNSMDRWVRKNHRIKRHLNTTPHAFARELEALPTDGMEKVDVAGWYRRWATTRYRATIAQETIDDLDAERMRVQQKKTV